MNEEIEVRLIEDELAREEAKTIGYYAMFEYTNGFRKAIYWSREKMEAHAKKFSPGYKKDLEKHTAWTFWAKDFDSMAYKTMLRQLISKWGIMSIDLVTALDADMAVIQEDGKKKYVETEPLEAQMEYEPVKEETKPEIKEEPSRKEGVKSVEDAFFDD